MIRSCIHGSNSAANILGLEQKGRILPGADPDLVLLDSEFDVLWTMIEGELFN